VPAQQRRWRDQERRPALPRQQPGQRGQDQAISWCVAGAGNLAAKHRQLVAQDGDLDVLDVWFRTEAHQPENAPYEEEDEGRGHAGDPRTCPSRLLRATILCLHPSPSWLLRAAILYLHPSGYGPLCHSFNYQPELPRSPP